MSINSGNLLDITKDKWTPQDFQKNQLEILGGDLEHLDQKTFAIAYRPLNAEPLSASRKLVHYVFSVLTETTHKILGNFDPKSIFKVKEALDVIADKEVDLIDHTQWKGIPIEKRLGKLNEANRKLQTLLENLQGHDTVIIDFNHQFKTGILACGTHEKMIQKVQSEIDELNKITTELFPQMENHFLGIIERIKMNAQNGQDINREFIKSSYPAFVKEIKVLPVEMQATLLQAYHTAINSLYVKNVIEKITSGKMEINSATLMILGKLGFPRKMIEHQTPEGSKTILESLSKFLVNSHLNRMTSLEVADVIQATVFQSFGSILRLNDISKKRLLSVLKKYHDFEGRWTGKYLEDLNSFKEIIKNHPAVAAEAHTLSTVDLFNPPSRFVEVATKLIEDSKLSSDLVFRTSDEDFEAYLLKIDQEMSTQKPKFALDDWTDQLLVETDSTTRWMKRAKKNHRFEFNQGKWGGQEILGDGACAAINYRWIKAIMKNPAHMFKSALELDPNFHATEMMEMNIPVKQEAKVLPQDRKIQAEQMLSTDRNIPWGLASHIIIRDGFQDRIIVPIMAATSIEQFIDYAMGEDSETKKLPTEAQKQVKNERLLKLMDSSGILDVAIYERNEEGGIDGHAIGVQIDRVNGVYRFWDVNSGMYGGYADVQELKREMSEYMNLFYHGTFDHFMASQYIPADT